VRSSYHAHEHVAAAGAAAGRSQQAAVAGWSRPRPDRRWARLAL